MQPLGSLIQMPTVVANKAFCIMDSYYNANKQLLGRFIVSNTQFQAIYVTFLHNFYKSRTRTHFVIRFISFLLIDTYQLRCYVWSTYQHIIDFVAHR